MTPIVSIVVPVYNGERYLAECIDSILRQDFRDFELLLLDDGSTDQSGKICDDYAERDSRIRVIHKQNEGINATRKRGASEAQGEWVMFVDDDDTLLPGALKKMTALTDGTDIVIGFPDVPAHRKPLSLEECRSNIITAKLIPPTPWAKLYRHSLLTDDIFDFPREIDGEEDMIMNIRLFFKTQKAPHILFEKVYNFRRNTVSVSHTKRASLEHEDLFDRSRNASIPSGEFPKYINEIMWSRLNGLHAAAISESHALKDSSYIKKIKADAKLYNYPINIMDRLIVGNNPEFIKRIAGYSFIVKAFFRYHLGLNN